MSKLNDLVGETLEKGLFKHYTIVPEYCLSRINPAWKSDKEKLDWVVKELKIAIEVDGEHHYKPTTYGGISKDLASNNLIYQKKRDNFKDHFCKEAGWTLIRIPYWFLKKDDIHTFLETYIIEEAMNGVSGDSPRNP